MLLLGHQHYLMALIMWLFQVNEFLKELPIKALPGIGRALEEKLKGRHVKTCGDLHMISKVSMFNDVTSNVKNCFINSYQLYTHIFSSCMDSLYVILGGFSFVPLPPFSGISSKGCWAENW